METVDKYARRRVIEEIIKRWIHKNPEGIASFASAVKKMRQGKPFENQMNVYKATIPSNLMRQIDFALQLDEGQRLFDPDGELEWFSTKFPEFIIPYDRTETVR